MMYFGGHAPLSTHPGLFYNLSLFNNPLSAAVTDGGLSLMGKCDLPMRPTSRGTKIIKVSFA